MNDAPPQLVLASTSRYRHELLARLGIPFVVQPPAIDEEACKDDSLGALVLAQHLARAKAETLRPTFADAVILGSDQTCACDGQLLHKPGNFEGACRQLAQLAGKSHELITAVCLVRGDERLEHVDVTRLVMRKLSRDEIERYVAADEPLDCVGAYKLEARGIALFEKIESADHTAITGLPLMAVSGLLRQMGFTLP
jgi:septum formation protein